MSVASVEYIDAFIILILNAFIRVINMNETNEQLHLLFYIVVASEQLWIWSELRIFNCYEYKKKNIVFICTNQLYFSVYVYVLYNLQSFSAYGFWKYEFWDNNNNGYDDEDADYMMEIVPIQIWDISKLQIQCYTYFKWCTQMTDSLSHPYWLYMSFNSVNLHILNPNTHNTHSLTHFECPKNRFSFCSQAKIANLL